MTMTIEVENIKCGGCMNTIKKELLQIAGIQDVNITKEEDKIDITGEVNRELIIQKLATLGYPEKGNNNLLHKAKSYVSCAVGRMGSES